MTTAQNVPHALVIPFPGQGHATPMMQLCKKLASQGFSITFLIAEHYYERILESHKLSGDLKLDIRLESVPLPVLQVGLTLQRPIDLVVVTEATKRMSDYVSQLLERLSEDGPRVTCIISDVLLSSWTQDLADKYQIPRIALFTCNQTFYLFFFYLPLLRARGQITFADGKIIDNGAENSTSIYFSGKDADAFPGMPPLRFQDLPTFVHNGDATEYMYDYAADQLQEIHRAERVLVNTLYELESSAIDALSSKVPTYAIGPLLPGAYSGAGESKSSGTSFLPEQDDCLQWLDGQPTGSVIYVSFGSVAELSREQFQEVALGLEASGQRFLWVLRPTLIKDDGAEDPAKHLPPDFLSRTKGRGYLVSWAPQLQVLSHGAVGAFLTHCGWNSTMESIANGVPMIGWPYFSDQMLDARLMVEEWGLGMEIRGAAAGGVVEKEEIQRVVKAMLEGEEGYVMRNKASSLKLIATKSIVPGGHSFNNVQAFVHSMQAFSSTLVR